MSHLNAKKQALTGHGKECGAWQTRGAWRTGGAGPATRIVISKPRSFYEDVAPLTPAASFAKKHQAQGLGWGFHRVARQDAGYGGYCTS